MNRRSLFRYLGPLALGVMAPALQAQDLKVGEDEYIAPATPYSPYVDDHFPQNAYFGDTHLHTAWSADAGMGGATTGPDVAYRAARGEVVDSQTAGPFKLLRPLDFIVVADHAENMGLSDYLERGDPLVRRTDGGERWYQMFKAGDGYDAFIEWIASNGRGEDMIKSPEMVAAVWQKVIDNAEHYYEPGVFTTFIGYEWTSGPAGNNLHRNVIFRDGADRTRQIVPFSALDSDDPEDLWDYLEAYEKETGGQVLAIPHNGNLSNGMMFMLETFDGEAFDEAYARRRAEYEPVVEVTQPKGTGETHPFLSPDDAFADHEIIDTSNLAGSAPKEEDMLRTEYARSALKLGLAEAERLGVNPYKFGMIGSTDAHNALPSTREENWFGKAYIVEPSPHRKDGVLIESTVDPKLSIYDIDLGASGLAGVWATENTREAIWDAFARREVFATSGSRLRVRVFGGWDFQPDEVLRPDFADAGYSRGVPMGGDLRPAPEGQEAPTFMVRALRDPDGANLDRIQIVKGWVDGNGETREKIWDVVCAGREIMEGACDGDVGNTVNVANASYTNEIGRALLAGHWTDPEFDPDQRAFYYVRVLEIPTPRWTAYDAKYFQIKMPEGTPMEVIDRAYTSPIWYTPEG
ncbi:DUF3604 domain-containing protein [Marinobacter sp. F4206]|uniref:DUF3604 domain-containing protein n=1 Tax=Marinobacter sp. F4206 TaxID=2861777 RepID=UPI001C601F29|nr:DUF3604 domain-containing protein [Marinobacter sp. F4206]MBW4935260.1 DUF3604 domain-containing protein [Marinobacter sp. F4206]